MFAILCLATFMAFISYWAAAIICKKTVSKIKSKSKSKSLPVSLNQHKDSQGQTKIQQKQTVRPPTFEIKFVNVKQVGSKNNQKQVQLSSDNENNKSRHRQALQKEQSLLKVGEKAAKDEQSMASSVNELNIAMIQQDVSRKQSNSKRETNELQKSSNAILHEIKEQITNYTPQNRDINNQSDKILLDLEPLTPIVLSFNNEIQRERRDQRSQLEIIQALTNPKINEKQDESEADIIQAYERKDSEVDFVILKLIQQIDQLFLNDQQKFMSIIDKYKIRQTRFATEQQTNRQINQKRLQQLLEILRQKQEQQQRLQIQISQYKQQNQEKQTQINKQKQIVLGLQCKMKQMQQAFFKKQEEIKSKQNQKVIQLTKNSQKLMVELKLAQQNIIKLNQQLRQKQVQFKAAQANLKKQVDILKHQSQTIQIENREIYNKMQQQLQQTKKQLILFKNKSNELQKIKVRLQSDNSNKSEQVLPQFGTKASPQQIEQTKFANQNLKNELEFAQTQIRMFEQSQRQNLQKIQKLQKQLSGVNSINFNQTLELRNKISRMQPIVNEFEVLQKRYFQMKLKYDRIVYQKQKDKTILRGSGVKQPALELSGSNLKVISPKANRSIINETSPTQQILSNNDKKSAMMGHYRFLFDCTFVNLQDRQFLYETIHNFLKGILKTEKLYNSKTNKSKNPHELIDNIRGILALVQLQNGKIIGAYTHQPFSIINSHSSADNIAFLLDVSNRKSFTNQSGINSISYNPSSLVWGLSQLMLKFQEPQVMYTNFCRNHNIYWDGKYKLQDFIGTDKQWARITQYQLFRVSKV